MPVNRPILYVREFEKQLQALGFARAYAKKRANSLSIVEIRQRLAWWRVLRIYWRSLGRVVGSLLSPTGAGGKPVMSDQTTLEGPVGCRRGKGAATQKRRPQRRADKARFHSKPRDIR